MQNFLNFPEDVQISPKSPHISGKVEEEEFTQSANMEVVQLQR